MPPAKRLQSDADVAARDQLDSLDQPDAGEQQREQLEEQVSDQEKQQRAELAAGSKNVSDGAKELGELAPEAPAGARRGTVGQGYTEGGFMDQLSRRSGQDALEGHYVTIDREADGVQDAYALVGLYDEDVAGDNDDPRDGYTAGFYGVMVTRGATAPDTGIPTEAVVRLRDSSHAIVRVPYDACSPAGPGGRGL